MDASRLVGDVALDAINRALDEVMDTYIECGNTQDGIIDVGPALRSLALLAGRDLESEQRAWHDADARFEAEAEQRAQLLDELERLHMSQVESPDDPVVAERVAKIEHLLEV